MLSPARLTQLLMEVVFLLLGALVVWLAANGRIYDRYTTQWLVLSVALVAWGLLALAKPGRLGSQWQKWNRGGSLILFGLLMFAMARVTFTWAVRLFAFAGLILFLRGLLGSLLIFRSR